MVPILGYWSPRHLLLGRPIPVVWGLYETKIWDFLFRLGPCTISYTCWPWSVPIHVRHVHMFTTFAHDPMGIRFRTMGRLNGGCRESVRTRTVSNPELKRTGYLELQQGCECSFQVYSKNLDPKHTSRHVLGVLWNSSALTHFRDCLVIRKA